MSGATLSPRTIIHTMRELQRQGVRMSYMNADAIKFIMDNDLIEQKLWPATYIHITESGWAYMCENEE